MAQLDNSARAAVTQQFIEAFFVGLKKTADLDNAEVRTLINDVDAWLDAKQSEANQAISLPVRTKASSSTKFAALAYVALKRAGVI
jgi:hypothetical protein